MKSRKWSARHRNAQDKICRVWEERGADYARLQQKYEEAEEARQKKARERREMEVAQVRPFLVVAVRRARRRSCSSCFFLSCAVIRTAVAVLSLRLGRRDK